MSDRCTFITTVAAMSSAILASSASAKASTAIKLNREKENRVSQINLFEHIFENGPANNSTAEKLNGLGAQGWRVVHVTVAFGGFVYTLERTKIA